MHVPRDASVLPSAEAREAELLARFNTLQQRETTPRQQHVQLGANGEAVVLADDSGKDCMVCTMMLGVMEQYAWAANLPLPEAAAQWCSDVTASVSFLDGACKLMLQPIMEQASADFAKRISPDVTCRTLGKCNNTPGGATCTLFPVWPPPSHSSEAPRLGVHPGIEGDVKAMHEHYASVVGKFLNVHAITEELLQTRLADLVRAGAIDSPTLQQLAKDAPHASWLPVPLPDLDGDKYGAMFTVRGLQWRGKDCNDLDAQIYPGRNALQGDFDAQSDSNCNGISGVEPNSKQPWESLLCAPYPTRGVLAIGDSATAHFSIPPSWRSMASDDPRMAAL
jgi:acyloxyacyl hydrolase